MAENEYKLIQAVDPSKIKVPIREKFAKLTLSSNKKQQQQQQQEVNTPSETKRKSASRNLLSLLQDTQQEQKSQQPQSQYVNPLLRSDSSPSSNITIEDEKNSFMTDDDSVEDADENCAVPKTPICAQIDLLSEQISALAVRENMSPTNVHTISETTSDDDSEVSEYSVITISDSDDDARTPSKISMNLQLITSNIAKSGQTADALLPDTLSNDKAERLEAFLRDVSQERREILQRAELQQHSFVEEIENVENAGKILAQADTQSMTASCFEEAQANVDVKKRNEQTALVNNEPMADVTNAAMPLDDTVPVSQTDSCIFATQLPQRVYNIVVRPEAQQCIESKRLAANDTVACSFADEEEAVITSSRENSLNDDVDDRSIYYASINRTDIPEESLVISETSSEEDAQADESVEEKQIKESNTNTSAVDSSSSASCYSPVQISMGKINISAKINIKIHIPQQMDSEQQEYANDDDDDDKNYKNNDRNTNNATVDDNDDENHRNDNDDDNNVDDDEIVNAKNANDFDKNNANKTDVNDEGIDGTCNLTINKGEKHNAIPSSLPVITNEVQPTNRNLQNDDTIENTNLSNAIAEICHQKDAIAEKTIDNTTTESPPSTPILKKRTNAAESNSNYEKLLNELYGNAWQTPDVLKTLKKIKPTPKKQMDFKTPCVVQSKGKVNKPTVTSMEQSLLDDFSIFKKDIVQTNLDSTRLTTSKNQVTAYRYQQIANSMPKQQNTVQRSKNEKISKTPMTENKSKTPNANSNKLSERWRNLIDAESSDEGENASDDSDADASNFKPSNESLKTDDTSSDEEPEYKVRSNKKNQTKTRNNKTLAKPDLQNKLIYLDLSKIEIEEVDQTELPESPPANHDVNFTKRLEDILRTCRAEDKPKLEATPKPAGTRRKLFNLYTTEIEENIKTPPESPKAKTPSTSNKIITFKDTVFPRGFEIINKRLEATKTGMPINAIATPKLPDPRATATPTPKQMSTTQTKGKQLLESLRSTPMHMYNFLKSLDAFVSKTYCHPDALIYRDNYRAKKQDLTDLLYTLYNEKLFDNRLNVPLVWNKKLTNTAGRCLNKKKMGVRSSVVELSDKVLTSADRLRCTLVHELCHAATWIFNGESGHGATWKQWALKANTVFPELPKINVCHQYEIEYKYTYKCTLCAAKSHAHSRSKKVENIRCAFCHGAIEIFLNKKDKEGNVIATPVREPKGFAKFVKDNYKQYKRPDLKHADVMKLLSNEFAALKVNGVGNI